MSKKNSNLAGFYLVPVDSYKTLAELRLKNEQLEKQLGESLKFKSVAATEKVAQLENEIKKLQNELALHKSRKENSEKVSSQVSSQRYEPPDGAANASQQQQQQQEQQQQQQGGSDISSVQQGGGDIAATSSALHDDNDFRQKLFSSFESFLKAHKLIQSGSGTLDLTPRIPIPMVEQPEVKPSPENVTDLDVMNHDQVVDNNDLNNGELDEEKLLGLVKNRYKDKAKELLQELQRHPSEISVLSNGSITLKGQVLPEANFYNLFPLLYSPVKNHRENPALTAVVDAISSLGLGHLILRYYTAGITPKGKNYLQNRGEISEHLNKNTPWFYLGGND